MNGQRAIHFPKPGRLRKGVLLSSEPLYLLEEDGIILIHLEASMNEQGNWRKREVRL